MGDGVQRMWATRFAIQIPLLAMIERDCSSILENIEERINVLWKDDEELRKGIIKWVKMLYSSNQRIRDWDISFLDHIATDENMPYDLTFEEKKYKISGEIIGEVGNQLREIDRYNQLYHPDKVKSK